MARISGLLFVLFCFTVFSVQASEILNPLEIAVGARPVSLGRAFSGVSGDPTSLFYNPSGLAGVTTWQASTMSLNLLSDVTYFMGVGAYPLEGDGTLGFSYVRLGTTGIQETNSSGTQTGTADFANSVWVVGYGQKFPRWFHFTFLDHLSLGLSAKLFTQGFSGGSGSLSQASGGGFDIDLGAQYLPLPWLTVGISQLNALPASWGGKFTWTTGLEESIPSTTKIGLVATLLGQDAPYQIGNMKCSLLLDADIGRSGEPTLFHFGGELVPHPLVSLRMGLDQETASGGAAGSVTVANNLALGVGLKLDRFSFDYAYQDLSGDASENMAHIFSIGLSGPSRLYGASTTQIQQGETISSIGTKEGVAFPEEKPPAVRFPPPIFSDVQPGHWAYLPITGLGQTRLMDGFPDGGFHPEVTLSRAELAALLVRLKEIEAGGELQYIATDLPFRDLQEGHWAKRYIAIAYENGWISGYGDGRFRPGEPLTRAEAIAVVTKFAEIDKMPDQPEADPFPDVVWGKHWGDRFVAAAKREGMLDYLVGRNFEPKAPFTRAEAAYVLSHVNFVQALLHNSVPVTQDANE